MGNVDDVIAATFVSEAGIVVVKVVVVLSRPVDKPTEDCNPSVDLEAIGEVLETDCELIEAFGVDVWTSAEVTNTSDVAFRLIAGESVTRVIFVGNMVEEDELGGALTGPINR